MYMFLGFCIISSAMHTINYGHMFLALVLLPLFSCCFSCPVCICCHWIGLDCLLMVSSSSLPIGQWPPARSKLITDVDGLVEVTEKDQLCCYLFKSQPRYI